MPFRRFRKLAEIHRALRGPSLQDILDHATAERSAGHPHPCSIGEFKQAAKEAVREYFGSSDIDEVATRLLELEEPGLHHIFVKHAVQLAMDGKDREREMVSVLLNSLYPQVLTGGMVKSGRSGVAV